MRTVLRQLKALTSRKAKVLCDSVTCSVQVSLMILLSQPILSQSKTKEAWFRRSCLLSVRRSGSSSSSSTTCSPSLFSSPSPPSSLLPSSVSSLSCSSSRRAVNVCSCKGRQHGGMRRGRDTVEGVVRRHLNGSYCSWKMELKQVLSKRSSFAALKWTPVHISPSARLLYKPLPATQRKKSLIGEKEWSMVIFAYCTVPYNFLNLHFVIQ
jgi:hypothetical protein